MYRLLTEKTKIKKIRNIRGVLEMSKISYEAKTSSQQLSSFFDSDKDDKDE